MNSAPTPRQPRRRPRRGALLGWTALLWVPLLAVGIALLVTVGTGAQAVRDYRDGRPAAAADRFGSLSGALIERWKAPFGQGTALLADNGSANLALYHLDRALDLVPDSSRCDVQTNRSVALARIGDSRHAEAAQYAEWIVQLQQIDQGTATAPANPPWGTETQAGLISAGTAAAEQAASRYGEAAAALEDPTCPDQQSDQEQQDSQDRADDLRDRQQDSDDLSDQMDPDTSDQSSDDPTSSPQDDQDQQDQQDQQQQEQDEEQQRQQELQDRNGQAQEDGDDDQGGGSSGTGDEQGSGGGDLPW